MIKFGGRLDFHAPRPVIWPMCSIKYELNDTLDISDNVYCSVCGSGDHYIFRDSSANWYASWSIYDDDLTPASFRTDWLESLWEK